MLMHPKPMGETCKACFPEPNVRMLFDLEAALAPVETWLPVGCILPKAEAVIMEVPKAAPSFRKFRRFCSFLLFISDLHVSISRVKVPQKQVADCYTDYR